MSQTVEQRFLSVIRAQLLGLGNKVAHDFSKESFEAELKALTSDPVYEKFSFNQAEYVLIRFMGRISISVGRRLGEIYDKVPRYAAAARFNLTPIQVAPSIGGLELDIGLSLSNLSEADVSHVKAISSKFFNSDDIKSGLGIEIRYNFNPNDSSRLRKDVKMGELLAELGMKPIYLVFSTISPRNDAITRLKNSGWNFLVGNDAIQFINELIDMDIQAMLDRPEIKSEIKKIVDEILKSLVASHAFNTVIDKYKTT